MQVQQQWMYLETIFSADIQRQLPAESKRFSMLTIIPFYYDSDKREPKGCCLWNGAGTKNKLAKHNITLDRIQKSLEDYLETKRQAFPRFYFLSNDELPRNPRTGSGSSSRAAASSKVF